MFEPLNPNKPANQNGRRGLATSPIHLYLIFEKSSLKNQVRRTGFLICKNQFRNWFLKATQAVKIQFEIGLKSSSCELIFPTWFLKNQVQMKRTSDSWYALFILLGFLQRLQVTVQSQIWFLFRYKEMFGKNLSRDQMKVKFKTIQMLLPTFRALLFLHNKRKFMPE